VRDDEPHMAFNFTLLLEPWDAERMRSAIDRSLAALASVGAPPTWVLESHDATRIATRYGSPAAARAAALLLLALPGPLFLYQGQELGLEEVDLPDELRQDPVFHRTNGKRKGRDGCRVPIPWEREPPNFGFTTGEPWLPMPRSWGASSIEAQRGDGGSTLTLYRRALELRPELEGTPLAWRESPPGTLVFERGAMVCAVNLAAERLALPPGELLVASEPGVQKELPPNASAWVRADER
jgi:alpha-glucosidase